MLKGISLGMAVIINIIIIFLWHFLSYLLSSTVGQKHVNYRRRPFRAWKFERYGNFYVENFDIESWYMLLPIQMNRDNITRKNLEEAEIPTLKAYLLTTCRSEYCCLINCLYFFFAVIVNVPYLGFIAGVLVVLCNMPFIMANRYLRFIVLREYAKKRKEREIADYIKENNPDKYDLDSF